MHGLKKATPRGKWLYRTTSDQDKFDKDYFSKKWLAGRECFVDTYSQYQKSRLDLTEW